MKIALKPASVFILLLFGVIQSFGADAANDACVEARKNAKHRECAIVDGLPILTNTQPKKIGGGEFKDEVSPLLLKALAACLPLLQPKGYALYLSLSSKCEAQWKNTSDILALHDKNECKFEAYEFVQTLEPQMMHEVHLPLPADHFQQKKQKSTTR